MSETKIRGMKRISLSRRTPFILACLIFFTLIGLPFSGSFLGIQSADAGDIVTNGIFSGTSPWTLTQGAAGTMGYNASNTNTADGSGSMSLSVSGRDVQADGYFEQSVTLSANQTVSSASMYTNLTTGFERTIDDVVVQLIYENDATTPGQACTSCITLISTGELTNSGWTPQSATNISLDPGLAVRAIRITMRTASGANKDATAVLLIDDLVINVDINATTAGTAEATAASATSISVSMPYSFDDNANNSCTVRYKKSSESTWTLDAPACSDDGSTLTKTISGLTDEGGYYDVEMTYNDSDGVTGTSPQFSYKVLLAPSDRTAADLATIRVLATAGGTMDVLVRMPFENDSNASNTYTVEYKLTSEPTVWTTHPDSPAAHQASGIYKTTISGLERDERYDIRLTYNDADGVAGWGSPQTYTDVLMNATIHNSYNYSMRKWGGKWGVVGGKYGEFVCTTCHERFPTANIKRIIDSGPIVAPNSPTDQFPGEVDVETVSFLSAVDGSSDFGDDSTTHTTSTKICEYCHSLPEYHKYNQDEVADHFNQEDCMKCHNHATGFYPAGGQCVNCHDQEQTQLYNTRQVVESSPAAGDGDFVRLSRHVSNGTSTQIVTNYDCAICHREADADIISAGEGWLDLYAHKNGSTQISRFVMLRDVDDINDGWKFNRYNITEEMRADFDAFCLGCHDDDGAAAISVNATGDGLLLGTKASPVARRLTPFNPNDNLQNGRDGFTSRTRVVDVKSQFYPGSYTWEADGSMPAGFVGTAYDGLPSQHNVLGPRYETTNASWTTWTGHTTRKGDVMSTAAETARLHCSDCHLVESNAHGAVNSWHMLLNGDLGDFTTDATQTADADVVCYKCHSSAYYTNVSQTSGVRVAHNMDTRPWAKTYGGADSSKLGGPCLLCHGGDGFGRIHGRGSSTDSDGDDTFAGSTYSPDWDAGPPTQGTYTKQRFMPGAWMRWDPDATGTTDADWAAYPSSGNCYFQNAPVTPTQEHPGQTFTNCTQHSGGSAGSRATNYGRATRY